MYESEDLGGKFLSTAEVDALNQESAIELVRLDICRIKLNTFYVEEINCEGVSSSKTQKVVKHYGRSYFK